jgi:hypothetical protein
VTSAENWWVNAAIVAAPAAQVCLLG